MTNLGHMAIKIARARSKSPTPTSAPGMCLREVRECYSIPSAAPTAIAAWEASPDKVRTTDWSKIPRGAAVFWSGAPGRPGHVAIRAGRVWPLLPNRGRQVWSTDRLRRGYFDKVDGATIAPWIGGELLGYVRVLNGVRIMDGAPRS